MSKAVASGGSSAGSRRSASAVAVSMDLEAGFARRSGDGGRLFVVHAGRVGHSAVAVASRQSSHQWPRVAGAPQMAHSSANAEPYYESCTAARRGRIMSRNRCRLKSPPIGLSSMGCPYSCLCAGRDESSRQISRSQDPQAAPSSVRYRYNVARLTPRYLAMSLPVCRQPSSGGRWRCEATTGRTGSAPLPAHNGNHIASDASSAR